MGKFPARSYILVRNALNLASNSIEIMATNRPPNKNLAIVGSGANEAAGRLIYMLGGIELPLLAKLQETGIDSYGEAAQELKNRNEELYFYTPKHRVTVKDQISSADGLLLVVTTPQASETFFTGSTVDKLRESASLFTQKKAIVLAKISENHKWSESVYNDLVQDVAAALQHIDISVESLLVIPTGLQGENFIDPSPNNPWYTKSTLVNAMDEIIS